jgi:heme a synthase
MSGLGLHRFSALLVVGTLLLVLAGASVVSRDAGLSVPDWPLSYGKVMPEMTGGVLYEHSHRLIATTVGFLTIILVAWLWRSGESRLMKYFGLAMLGAVILQGVLGGLTVKFLLPKPVSISHACLAQIFFAMTICMAIFTSNSWKQGPRVVEDAGWPPLRRLAWVTPAAVLAQIALGAAYRHKALSVIPHIAWAFGLTLVVMIISMFVLTQFKDHALLRKSSWALLSLTLAQILLGVGAYVARLQNGDQLAPGAWMVALTVAHVGLGALVFGAAVAQSLQILRNVRTAPQPSAQRRELASQGRAL